MKRKHSTKAKPPVAVGKGTEERKRERQGEGVTDEAPPLFHCGSTGATGRGGPLRSSHSIQRLFGRRAAEGWMEGSRRGEREGIPLDQRTGRRLLRLCALEAADPSCARAARGWGGSSPRAHRPTPLLCGRAGERGSVARSAVRALLASVGGASCVCPTDGGSSRKEGSKFSFNLVCLLI